MGLASPPAQNSTPTFAGTYQDFDSLSTGTTYITATHVMTPATFPVRLDGGPTGVGKYMQLVPLDPSPAQNSLAFDRSDLGNQDMVVADFDFRITTGGDWRADGFGFALLNTSTFGTSGAVSPQAPWYASEEPDFADSFGLGFDIYDNGPPLDTGANRLSVHFDGSLIQEYDATQAMNLAEGVWTHARVILRPGGGYSDVTVILTPCGGNPVTVINQYPIPGLEPYEGRAYFAARTSNESAAHEIDNVHVQFSDLSTSVFSLQTGCATVVETENAIELTVTRLGDVSGTASVDFATMDVSATSGSDFAPISGTLTFADGETTQSLTIPILDDTDNEGDEVFQVNLSNPTGNGIVGGPEIGKITIVDDEAHEEQGYWGEIIPLPVVPIHLHMLPTGQVLFWDRGDAGFSFDSIPRLWDPTTQIVTPALPVNYDLFCSGHSFLADGRLLVTGGHIDNSIGEEEASIYDPFTGTWEFLPDMNAGRWYPSNVTLGTGEVLVIGGTYSGGLNRLPQVWQPDTGTWRNLTTALQGSYPNFADYYPFLFQAGNGKVFYAGPQQTARYLDTSGTGTWMDAFPSSMFYRDYGSAVMFDDGKVLMAGGSLRDTYIPVFTAEVITLTDATPTWQMTGPMNFARRHLNLTLLPDGTVLATGGSSAPGFNNSDGAPLNAEVWDPATGEWTVLAAADRFRGYHSTAVLLPDGRVLTGGGGHPNPDTGPEYNFEIFSPPYLFKGPRPTIATAPNVVTYDQSFTLQTPDAADIQKVTWIRLGSVTHAFNQNQRINHLAFTVDGNRLHIDAPIDPNMAPPGHYMLFILNSEGVPSIAHIIQILPEEDIEPPIALFSSSSPDALGEATLFTNLSTGTDITYGWDFGDGTSSTSTTLETPTHIYSTTGTFSVTLTITNALGTDSLTLPVDILELPNAGFISSTPDALGTTTTFTNTSIGTDLMYGWDFGDATSSTLRDPTHTYPTTGTFTVTLTITNVLGTDSLALLVDILELPNAGFVSSSPDALGTTTTFINTSTGTDITYGWEFGDGAGSTLRDPNHVYSTSGTFSVTLTITNALGMDSFSLPVNILSLPSAGFITSSPDALGTITTFTNTSTGTDLLYGWEFGDGAVSTLQNPAHTYPTTGTFTATLTITNALGIDSFSLPVNILQPATAAFTTSSPDFLGELTTFTNTSTGTALSYLWDFGDGITSTGQNPSHYYKTTGVFTVTLTITNAVGNDIATAIVEIIIISPPPPEEIRIFLPIVWK